MTVRSYVAAAGLTLALLTGGADAAGAASGTPAVPPRMHVLDFLLGSWRCATVVSAPGAPGPETVVAGTIRPVQGGAWYQWDAVRLPTDTMPQPALSRWVFGGWNEAAGTYQAIYIDDRGQYGQEASAPGAVPGHITFSGTFVTSHGTFHYTDDFVSHDRNHFVDTISVRDGDRTSPAGSVDCIRR